MKKFFIHLCICALTTVLVFLSLAALAQGPTVYSAHINHGVIECTVTIDPVNDIATVHDHNFGGVSTYPIIWSEDGFLVDNDKFPILFQHASGLAYTVNYIVMGQVFETVVLFESR